MEFQVLDVDYVIVDGRPIIRVFGKDHDGKTVCGFYENYPPYFYAVGQGIEEALKDNELVSKTEPASRRLPTGHQEPTNMSKIILKNPAKTPEVRDMLLSRGIGVYEADIPFKYRWMNDLGLNGMKWIKTNEGNAALTNTVNTTKQLQLKDMEQTSELNNAPLKYMALDIETVPSREGLLPEARRDPIIMISMVFAPDGHDGQKDMLISTRSGDGVTAFDSEKEMLQELIKIIDRFDPDILTGFNINNFDLPYILERMRQVGVKPVFGRCKQKHVVARKLMNHHRISISGRVIVDSFEIVKKDYSLKRYSLDQVAAELLEDTKEPLGVSGITKLWKGGEKDFQKLIEYSKKDSVLAMDLILKLNLLDKYFALSKISGILLQDILDSGETTRIENLLLREFNHEGYVMPCRPRDTDVRMREKKRKKELKGGYVKEPEKGLQSSVIVLDFKSMYPSLIRTFNICPTTLVKSDGEGTIKTPSGAMFLPKEKKQGIIPRILENLMKERQVVKSKLMEASDENKKHLLDAEQWALKIMSNAFYGHMGYSRARIYNLDVANAITSSGRQIIQETEKTIEKDFKYKVIYGDTDSVLVRANVEDMDELAKIGKDISENITRRLPGVMELEFEKIFKRFLALTKKRYMAWKFEKNEDGWKESIETKGIETVRRDWCTLTSESMQQVIGIILKKNDTKGAVEYFKGVIDDIMNHRVPIEKFVVTKTITKRPENYAGIQPHVELVKKMQQRSAEAPGVGDRVGYVIIKGTQMLSKRAEDPEYVKENGLEVDSKYYIENQLLPPLERIFSGLGISKSELFGRGKQMGIMDALKNHKRQRLSSMPLENVNGFICIKCNRSYRRPGLMGRCECGGDILFSSPQGPADFAVVS